MKNRMKKVLSVLLAVALFAGILPMTSRTVQAADPYMKKMSLKWDLKKNKNMPLTAEFAGIGKKKYQAKVTMFKEEAASKEGYRQITLQYTVTRKWTPSAEEVDKILTTCYVKRQQDYCYLANCSGYAVVDYDTGVSLETKNNDFGVSVKSLKEKAQGTKKYKGKKKGNWIGLPEKVTRKVQVTYPESYDGLCIGLLGDNVDDPAQTSIAFDDGVATAVGPLDSAFFTDTEKYIKNKKKYTVSDDGQPIKFGDTSYYKKGKKNSHWMKVKEV